MDNVLLKKIETLLDRVLIIQDDHEKRIRQLERFLFIVIGIAGFISFLINIVR